jgi:hypothetical protein
MEMDQSALGALISELMEETEADPEVPANSQIGRIVAIVELVGPEGEEGEFTSIRVKANARPYVAIGLLEVAKRIQLKMMGLD